MENINELIEYIVGKIPIEKQNEVRNFLDNNNSLNILQKLSILCDELKIFENDENILNLFNNIDKSIETKDDLKAINQLSKLELQKQNMVQNYEIIPANPEYGFNYPFILYVPDTIDENQSNDLLFHACNTPYSIIDYSKTQEFTIVDQLNKNNNLPLELSSKEGVPLIIPIIPRYQGYNPEYIDGGIQRGTIENFINAQNDLSSKYKMNNEQITYEYNRSQNIIHQQMNMINYAIEYLSENGINMNDKIIVEGHSAGSKTAASLINKYPNKIDGYIIGGTTGIAEVYDKTISGIVYNGENDTNNPRDFYINEKGDPQSKNITSYPNQYVDDIFNHYKESYNEWGNDNLDRDDKEFNIVKFDIEKQHKKLLNEKNIKSLLIKGYGHDAINSKEVMESSEELIKKIQKKNNLLTEYEKKLINQNTTTGFINLFVITLILFLFVIIILVKIK